ncbi:hypothetical protein ACC809_36845, partial [Rhizobium johnstonii]
RKDRVWLHITLLTGKKVWFAGITICAAAPSRRVLSTETFPSFGTPKNGSQIADFLKNWTLYRKVYGPAGQQLVTDQAAMTELFG